MRNYNTDDSVKAEVKAVVDSLVALCKQHKLPLVCAVNYGATKEIVDGSPASISYSRQVTVLLSDMDRAPHELLIAAGFINGLDEGSKRHQLYRSLESEVGPAAMLADEFPAFSKLMHEGNIAEATALLIKEGITLEV